jgi:hypothetical protein
MITGVAVGRVLGVNAVPASPSAPEPSSKVAAKGERPAENRVADLTGASLVTRAKSGEPEAMAAIEQRPVAERAIDETLALAEGRTARERRAIDVLRAQCSDHPELLDDVRTATKWLAYARNPAVGSVALAALASLPSPTAGDLVYEVWIGTEGRTAATQIAQEMLYAPAFRKWASPGLAIALDLRATESCESILALLPRAIEAGDRRSLQVLVKLNGRRNCGPSKTQYCYPCLHGSPMMSSAIRATRERSAPTFEGG